jgi:hypothetical protein
MRSSTSALLGALGAVAGWIAWSLLAPANEPASALAAGAPVAANTLFDPKSPTAQPAPARAPEARAVASAPAATTAMPPRAVALREGQVMAHGLPTAVHASSDDGTSALAAPSVALPAGVRPEDAVVNRAGMVALTRSATAPSTAAVAPDNTPRPPVATHAP